MKKTVFTLLTLAVFATGSFAESRIWRDKKGNTYEGEYKKALFGDVLIETPERRTIMIPIDELTERDKTYLYTLVPPEMDINYSKTSRIRPPLEWTITGDQTILYDCEVEIAKESDLPYRGRLIAELFVIGEEIDGENFVLTRMKKVNFMFPEGRDSTFTFQAKDVPFRSYTSNWAEGPEVKLRGSKYLGYLIVVSDLDGNILQTKTDLGDQEWLAEDMEAAIYGLRDVGYNGRGSIYSRHFDEYVQKSEVPRINWYKRTKWF